MLQLNWKIENKIINETIWTFTITGGVILYMKNNKFYNNWLKKPWPYALGAILLSLLQIITLSVSGEPWGVSVSFPIWGARLFKLVGGNVDKWYYFSRKEVQATLTSGFFNEPSTLRNIGIIVGALLAALLASEFKIKKIKSIKQVVAAILGGLLMGYGSRIANGCNIGALYSGISSLSLSGWIFGIFLFLGAFIGSKLLIKFFM